LWGVHVGEYRLEDHGELAGISQAKGRFRGGMRVVARMSSFGADLRHCLSPVEERYPFPIIVRIIQLDLWEGIGPAGKSRLAAQAERDSFVPAVCYGKNGFI
jgi:hypothetical protein